MKVIRIVIVDMKLSTKKLSKSIAYTKSNHLKKVIVTLGLKRYKLGKYFLQNYGAKRWYVFLFFIL